MNSSRLNEYSRSVATRLLHAMPDLEAHARIDDTPGVQDGCLLIEVPSANPRAQGNLLLTTDDDEITVIWNGWHTHLNSWCSPDADEVKTVVDLLRSIFEERFVISVTMEGETWKGSSGGAPGEVHATLERNRPKLAAGMREYALSWKGTYDMEIRAS